MKTRNLQPNVSDDFLVSVISSAPYGILAINMEGFITLANIQARDFLDLSYSVKELTNRHISDCVIQIPKLKSAINRCLRNNRKPFNLESVPFGSKHLTFRGRLIHNGYIITIENITRFKEMEAIALNSTFVGQEQERMRLAKEIHDGLGPILSTVKLNLDALYSELYTKVPDDLLHRLADSIGLIDSLTTDIRNISRDLMPKVLSDFGLAAALENLCRSVNESLKLKVGYYTSIREKRYDNALELSLFRIGQELINNAIKHSGAEMINVQLIEHTDSIVLMVEDNGRGFDEIAINHNNQGIGLINVESRAKALGGEFFFDSVEGRGVTATVEIPFNR